MVNSYQSALADAANAGDGFARGNLEGDVQVPKEPFHDPTVKKWEALTEPRLMPVHDTVGQALASFFTDAGGWVYLTQQMIADAARLSRPTTNRALLALEEVGRFERRDIDGGPHGKRGEVYRLQGEDTNWQPTALGLPGRVTPVEFRQSKRIHELEEAVMELAGRVTDGHDLPDIAVGVLQGRSGQAPQNKRLVSEYYASMDIPPDTTSLLSKSVNNALSEQAEADERMATETQISEISRQQDRTGLTDGDIREAWAEINPGSQPPEYFEAEHIRRGRASRLIRWLRRQEDMPAYSDDDLDPIEERARQLDAQGNSYLASYLRWKGHLPGQEEGDDGPDTEQS